MGIHDRYSYEIQHEIALLKTGKANYAILSQLSITFQLPDDMERVHVSWKDIATTAEYEDEQYQHA